MMMFNFLSERIRAKLWLGRHFSAWCIFLGYAGFYYTLGLSASIFFAWALLNRGVGVRALGVGRDCAGCD